MTPYGLRVEHLDHPLGILTAAPRLSWRLPPGATGQRAYRIRTGNGWDTGPVVGSRSLLVGYEGPALRSAERVTWQVKVWTDRGESDWSAPGWFETGLLHAGDWRQDWIEPGAPLLRTAFTGRPTRLYLTAHGVYEAFVNGERVGDAELTPGFTQYRSRLQVQTYDIAALVRPGENVLAVVLSGGWWCGQTGALRATRQWGTRVAVLAQFDDGAIGPWRCARGHLTSADLIARPARRPHRAAARLDRAGLRRLRLGRRPGGPPRLRHPGGLAGAAGAPGRGDRAGRDHPAAPRPAGDRPRAEHQRLDQAGAPRSG
nr:hypothetical protein GCM10020092_038940 [Actinoplanes digitatis]